jgi:hypothetical protein
MLLIDNIDRDEQLNTAYSLESPIAIALRQVLFKLHNRQSIYTVKSYHKFKGHKRANDIVYSKVC